MELGHCPGVFSVGRYRLTLTLKQAARLPEYKGSTLRGGFGHVFKRLACSARQTSCPKCILKATCPYSYVFETPRPQGAEMMRLYPQIPRPFVINPYLDKRRNLSRGDTLQVGLTLVGKAIDYLPYFIYTFEELGKTGLGADRAQFELSTVNALMPDGANRTVYDADSRTIHNSSSVTGRDLVGHHTGSRATLKLLTPLRLRVKGEVTDQLQFRAFFSTLLRRLSALSYFHCGSELQLDFKQMVQNAATVRCLEDETEWYQWGRFSKRQGRRMRLGGLIGKITFEGDLEDFWPWLELGEAVHVGKATTFGLGGFEIADSASEKS